MRRRRRRRSDHLWHCGARHVNLLPPVRVVRVEPGAARVEPVLNDIEHSDTYLVGDMEAAYGGAKAGFIALTCGAVESTFAAFFAVDVAAAAAEAAAASKVASARARAQPNGQRISQLTQRLV